MASLRQLPILSRVFRNRTLAGPTTAVLQRAPYSTATATATAEGNALLHPMHTNPKENQTITLHGGRTLGFAEYGDSNGKPCFWFHGTPSSRFEGYDWDEAGKKVGARIIAPDRPGFGLSMYQAARKITYWPEDVKSLAKHLGLEKYHIMGGSGGGPFVVACANALPKDVLLGSGIVAGVGPWHVSQKGTSRRQRIAWGLRVHFPGLVTWINKNYLVPMAKDPEKFRRMFTHKFIDGLKENDKKMFRSWTEDQVMRFSEGFREALRPGHDGDKLETEMFLKDWDIKLEDIDSNPIKIFWGDEDESCSRAWQEYQADHIKNATLTVIPGETHFTICDRHGERMLREVLAIRP